jgi:hypothetical protein
MFFTRFSLLVVPAILLAGGPGLATLPDPVGIGAGLVSGVSGRTANVRVFKGIPLAAPPVGPLRWRPPQPVAGWAGVRRADQFGARCMQPTGGAGGRGVTAAAAPAPSEPFRDQTGKTPTPRGKLAPVPGNGSTTMVKPVFPPRPALDETGDG